MKTISEQLNLTQEEIKNFDFSKVMPVIHDESRLTLEDKIAGENFLNSFLNLNQGNKSDLFVRMQNNMNNNLKSAIEALEIIGENPELSNKVAKLHPNLVEAERKVAESLKIQAALSELKRQTLEIGRTVTIKK